MNQCYIQNQGCQPLDLRIGMSDKGVQPPNVPRGDIALVQETSDFVQPLDAVAFLTWHALAIFANAVAVAAPAELFVRASATADATEMTHAAYRIAA